VAVVGLVDISHGIGYLYDQGAQHKRSLDQCFIRANGVKWLQMLKGRNDKDMAKDKRVKC